LLARTQVVLWRRFAARTPLARLPRPDVRPELRSVSELRARVEQQDVDALPCQVPGGHAARSAAADDDDWVDAGRSDDLHVDSCRTSDVHALARAQPHPAARDAVDEPDGHGNHRDPDDDESDAEREDDKHCAERDPQQAVPERADLPDEVRLEPGAAHLAALQVVDDDG